MNKQIEALKMAIEAFYAFMNENITDEQFTAMQHGACMACKEALAEAEKQEPVAYVRDIELINLKYYKSKHDNEDFVIDGTWMVTKFDDFNIPLYTHPATWQSLSDDEIQSITWKVWGADALEPELDYARAIEQALKEKNNG